jgi:hypothetical protein
MAPQRVVVSTFDRPGAQPIAGVLLLALGGWVFKMSAIDPVLGVLDHASSVSYSTRGTLMSTLLIVLAIALLVASVRGMSLRHSGGRASNLRDPNTGKLTRRGWAFVAAVVALCGAVEWGFHSFLRDHGYDDSRSSRHPITESDVDGR